MCKSIENNFEQNSDVLLSMDYNTRRHALISQYTTNLEIQNFWENILKVGSNNNLIHLYFYCIKF